MRIRWSDIAEADLDQLYDYIARDVPYYAEQFVDRLIEAVGVLEEHPKIGRRVPETEDREDIRDTPSLADRINAFADPVQARKDFIARQPMGRLGSVEDITGILVFLVSDESLFATGNMYSIDGGMTI